jgi:lipopolysaccharide transport system ATP-binding protein
VVRERSYGRILCAQVGGSFHVRHPVFASNAYGVFHEAGQWRVSANKTAAAEPAEASDELR